MFVLLNDVPYKKIVHQWSIVSNNFKTKNVKPLVNSNPFPTELMWRGSWNIVLMNVSTSNLINNSADNFAVSSQML